MTTKHTEGPWRFTTSPQPNGCPIVGSNGLMICMLAHSINHEDQKEEALANAALIAAAPDMKEALEKIIAMNRQTAQDKYGNPDDAESWSCVTVARAAIHKATSIGEQ